MNQTTEIQPVRWRSRNCFQAGVIWLLILPAVSAADSAHNDFFEKQIRPLLIDKCLQCHGAEKQSGGLRIDSAAALSRGGDGGPVIVPGKPNQSRLISAVRRTDELAMPPEDDLTAVQIAALRRWVQLGAPWPDVSTLSAPGEGPHWAFRPIRDPDIPAVAGTDWVRTPIDAFVLARLWENNLAPSPAADRRTLIRRATFDLTGLPPSPADVEAFANDDQPRAWQRLIDRLLDSPHYGEKWGRHWLDVARYSDSKGYVYAREERHWVHAWTYRDWVVKALNDDLPYDRFLLLQIAADQVAEDRSDLAAMGFLTIGRRFLGVTHDIIDDRIDVVTRGTMGLTVGCARCHDHKYDPISTEDYYSLYGVFRNCVENLVPLADIADQESEFAKGLTKRENELHETMNKWRSEAADRVRAQIEDYLAAQLELEKYPEEGFDQVFVENDIMPEFVRRWRDYLDLAAQRDDSVFSAWRMFRQIPEGKFRAAAAADVCQQIRSSKPTRVHPEVAMIFSSTPESMSEVVKRYSDLFDQVDRQYHEQGRESAGDLLIDVLYGPDSPCEVPDEPIVSTERFFPSSQCEKLWRLSGEVDRWLINSAQSPPYTLLLVDRRNPVDARVLRRGNPATLGKTVPRRLLSLLGGSDERPFQNGSGRLELARSIIDPANPLTARVAVNRVWMHHFGSGLVSTASDFGRRADPPSHPGLLDWLATRFIAEGWSLKQLHRLIMRSSVYRQSSFGPTDQQVLRRAERQDPENRLLWRMNPRRLTFEEIRDVVLATSGNLDPKLGGKPADLFQSDRRTLYSKIDRQFFSSVLRVFDVASPDLHIARRTETTVPQQALFFMNHPFLIEQSTAFADRVAVHDELARVRMMYRAAYQREPDDEELRAALQLVHQARVELDEMKDRQQPSQWQYGYGEYDGEQQRLIGFRPLPYFDGKAWQGGPRWPDASLGWVQLTAAGGHAGNDKQHAAVRRWTAPGKMRIKIESELIHEAKPGDGIRGFLVSGRGGLVKESEVHMRTERFDAESLEVELGDTIDFVVDLRDNLNSEEFLWETTITELPPAAVAKAASWNSRQDFAGIPTDPLSPWEQLAQVLLAANEFVFVD